MMVKEILHHNCCKECKFEWKRIDPFDKEPAQLQCMICGRTFEEIKLVNMVA